MSSGSQSRSIPHRDSVKNGLLISEDFNTGGVYNAEIGRYRWFIDNLSAGTASILYLAGATQSEWDNEGVGGSIRIRSQSVANQGTSVSTAASNMVPGFCRGFEQVGSHVECKIKLDTSKADVEFWVGLTSDNEARHRAADAPEFVGFRIVTSGTTGDWEGVVKDGAGSENTVTLVSSPALDAWHHLRLTRTATGVQFHANGAAVGAEITTKIPDTGTPLVPVLGAVTTDGGGAMRWFNVDWVEFWIPLNAKKRS